jgi:hypothetical protein
MLTEWAVVTTGSFFKETARLPENKASFRVMMDEVGQIPSVVGVTHFLTTCSILLQQMQLSKFLCPEVMERNIHLSAIRQLTRNLDEIFDGIHEEIVLRSKYHFTTKPKRAKKWWRKASKERVDLETDEWAEGNAFFYTFYNLVSHLNQRILVGPTFGSCFCLYCCGVETEALVPWFSAHDEEWMSNAVNLTADLAIRGTIVFFTPSFLRSYVYS